MENFAPSSAETTVVAGTLISLVQGDLTIQEVDAVVNAANSSLLGGGGVDGAIHRRGGPEILRECEALRARQGGCPTGEAVVTTAGQLVASWVIHTVGPIWNGGQHDEAQLLAMCYRNCLRLAMEHGVSSIAFPSISTGAYCYPIETASRIALTAVRDALLGATAEQSPNLAEVRFVLFEGDDYQVYRAALNEVIHFKE